jgi:hypothetical protein
MKQKINTKAVDTNNNGTEKSKIEFAQKRDKGKVPVRVDQKTIILANKKDIKKGRKDIIKEYVLRYLEKLEEGRRRKISFC